jgi:beta-lactamase superfamily II metal-dependent hydrolase
VSLVKSFAVNNGDMFYIKHGSDNFTIIDCCMPYDTADEILAELKRQSKGKSVVRFISTHPDQDHLAGLVELDDELGIRNFYCVANEATKPDRSEEFDRYCELRDDAKKAYHISSGCSRRWMNKSDERRGGAGIDILWPITANVDYRTALANANAGGSPNNISCIIKYSRREGASMIWMGDLETDFMEDVQDAIDLPEIDILFAPHQGGTPDACPPNGSIR